MGIGTSEPDLGVPNRVPELPEPETRSRGYPSRFRNFGNPKLERALSKSSLGKLLQEIIERRDKFASGGFTAEIYFSFSRRFTAENYFHFTGDLLQKKKMFFPGQFTAEKKYFFTGQFTAEKKYFLLGNLLQKIIERRDKLATGGFTAEKIFRFLGDLLLKIFFLPTWSYLLIL